MRLLLAAALLVAAGAAPHRLPRSRLRHRRRGLSTARRFAAPTLTTPSEYRPLLPVVRHVVNSEAFEGISSWLIGYEGQTCVLVTTDLSARVIRLTFTYAVP